MTQDSVLNEENKKTNAAKPAPERPKRVNTGLKLVLEFGPLALFFVANHKYGIYAATGALMVGVLAALGVAWSITRRLPMMPVVTAVLLLIFGGLTFLLQDETFIKMKVTILYTLFGGALLGALWFDRLLLPIVFLVIFATMFKGTTVAEGTADALKDQIGGDVLWAPGGGRAQPDAKK